MPKDSANNPSWLDKTEPIERNPHSPKPERKTPELKEHRGKDEVLRFLDGKVPLRIHEVERLNVRDERYTYVSITDVRPDYDLSSESKLATWRRRTRWGQGGTFGNPLVAPKPKATDRAAQDRLKDYKGDKKPSLVLEAFSNVAKTRWEISLENFGGITISAVARKKRGKWYAFVGYQDSESYRVIAHLMSADCSSAEQAFNRLFHVKRWFYVNGQWHDLFMPYKSVCVTGFGHRTLPSDYVSFTYHRHVPNSMFAWEFERPEFVPAKQYVSQHITSLKTVYHLSPTIKEQLRQKPITDQTVAYGGKAKVELTSYMDDRDLILPDRIAAKGNYEIGQTVYVLDKHNVKIPYVVYRQLKDKDNNPIPEAYELRDVNNKRLTTLR